MRKKIKGSAYWKFQTRRTKMWTIGEVAVLADNRQITRVPIICNWQWQITSGARYHLTARRAQFWISNFILITYLYPYATLQRVRATVWLKGGEMASKKEHFGVFRADNNPAKREVNPASQLFCCAHSVTLWLRHQTSFIIFSCARPPLPSLVYYYINLDLT